MAYFRRRPRPAIRQAPCELDADMTAKDIAAELRQLKFERDEFNAIKIDADVRDFLVASLSTRHATRRA
jgi:hypothetical protein